MSLSFILSEKRAVKKYYGRAGSSWVGSGRVASGRVWSRRSSSASLKMFIKLNFNFFRFLVKVLEPIFSLVKIEEFSSQHFFRNFKRKLCSMMKMKKKRRNIYEYVSEHCASFVTITNCCQLLNGGRVCNLHILVY